MEIIIQIFDGTTRLALQKEGKMLDHQDIKEERSLSLRLLPEIDGILRRNGLKSADIREMRVESDQADSFTTTRIAKAVANAWNTFGLKK